MQPVTKCSVELQRFLVSKVRSIQALLFQPLDAAGQDVTGRAVRALSTELSSWTGDGPNVTHLLNKAETWTLGGAASADWEEQLLKSSVDRFEGDALFRDVGSVGASPVLLELDSTWWSLRATLDKYLSSAKRYAQAMGEVASMLQSYTSCSIHNAFVKLSIEDAKAAYELLHSEKQLCNEPGESGAKRAGQVLNQTLQQGLELHLLQGRLPPSSDAENADVLQQSALRAQYAIRAARPFHQALAHQSLRMLCDSREK
eukprot:g20334.t1